MEPSIVVARNGSFTAAELNELLRDNHWQVEPLARLEQSLRSVWGCVTARTVERRLIGHVQVLSDGVRHAYVMKLIVHSEFRKRGIGSLMMAELMGMVSESGLLPTLVATPGNAKFYEKFGFQSVSNGYTAMCIR
jgi:ribosomal protein S18 acetylase RimI-like enzyme